MHAPARSFQFGSNPQSVHAAKYCIALRTPCVLTFLSAINLCITGRTVAVCVLSAAAVCSRRSQQSRVHCAWPGWAAPG
jgi:hypothetical protein